MCGRYFRHTSGEELAAAFRARAIEVASPPPVGAVHDRMPAIIPARDYARWLGEEPEHLNELKALLQPFDASQMMSWPMSRALNKPGAVDDASLLDPVS